jgi:hypothetical protein
VLPDCGHHGTFSITRSDGSLNVSVITEKLAAHLLHAEETLRKLPETQARYVASRCAISPSNPVLPSSLLTSTRDYWVLEDDLQMEIMRMHGITGLVSNEMLAEYRQAIAKHYHSPLVQQSAFFIRLNIFEPGAPVGSRIPTDEITLYSLAKESWTLEDYIHMAASEGKQLAILAGSIT